MNFLYVICLVEPLTDSNSQKKPRRSSARSKKSAGAAKTPSRDGLSSKKESVREALNSENNVPDLERPQPSPPVNAQDENDASEMLQYNDVPEALTSALIRARSAFRPHENAHHHPPPLPPQQPSAEPTPSPGGSIKSFDEEKLPPKKRRPKNAATPPPPVPVNEPELEQPEEAYCDVEQEEPLNLSKDSCKQAEEDYSQEFEEEEGPLDLSDRSKTPRQTSSSLSVRSLSSWQRSETYDGGPSYDVDRGRWTSGYCTDSSADLRGNADYRVDEERRGATPNYEHLNADNEEAAYGTYVERGPDASDCHSFSHSAVETGCEAERIEQNYDVGDPYDEQTQWHEEGVGDVVYPKPDGSVLRALLDGEIDADSVKNRGVPSPEEPASEEVHTAVLPSPGFEQTVVRHEQHEQEFESQNVYVVER